MGHIDFFLKKPIFTFIVIGILILIGMNAALNMNVETLPEVSTPVMFAAVPLPGGAPEEVESLVTKPLEDKFAEMEGIDRITSSSWQNVSIVVVYFKESEDQEVKFKEFREKMDEARPQLPAEILEPIMEKISFENLPMMFLGFAGNGKSQYELSQYASEIKKKIEKIQGVSKVVMEGATDKQVEIAMDPEALGKYGSEPLRLLVEKLGAINTNMPGGAVKLFNKEYAVRTIGKFNSIEDLKNMVVAEYEDQGVRLSDMAEVSEQFPAPDTIVRLDGERGVTLGIMKKRGYGTLDVATKVKSLLAEYPDVVPMADSSAFIEHQMSDLRNHSLWGAALVMLVLFLALGFRVAAIVTFALPMSFFLTFMAMGYRNMTINMVTLFSLLLALGMMVDNSIVVCENIFRHRSLGKSAYEAALEGTSEVSWPIFSSTAAIVAAFLPMAIFLTGPIGEFTRPISIIVSFALLASLVVANFFNPLMCMTFISDKAVAKMESRKEKKGGEFGARAREAYSGVMSWCLDHGFAVMSAALLILAASIMLMAFKVIGVQLFPQLDTQKFYIDVKAPAGNSIEDTMTIVKKIEKEFDDSRFVDHYISNVGSSGTRIEIDDRIFFGANIARFIVDLKPMSRIDKSHKEVIQEFRDKFRERFEGTGVELNFIEKALGPPVGAPICVRVTGDHYGYMGKMTGEIEKMLSETPGVIDLKDDMPGKIPQIVLEANQANLGRMGMTTRDIGGFIFLTLTGYKIGDIVLDGEKKNIFLKIKQKEGADAMAIQSATFTMPNGKVVKFSDILGYKFTDGLSAVEHEQGKRTVTIEAGVSKGHEAKRVMDDMKSRIDARLAELIKEDDGFSELEIKYGGEEMLIGQAARDLLTAMFVSLLLIYLILLIEFRSTTQPLIILVCVPYALVGVILGLLIMGYSFSVLAGIGLLCLIGIVVNNGIIYIDYANLLQSRGLSLREACLETCLTRLRPIVLTKVTVILGIMPLALASASKTQFWKPLCWAIIWGLIIATTLTLVIIPVAYYITEGWRKNYYAKRQ